MTAFNTSFVSSPALVDVVDFDNEVSTYEIEAASASEASEQAEEIAMSAGVQVSYCNV